MRKFSYKSTHRGQDGNTKPGLQQEIDKSSNWNLSNLVLTSKAVLTTGHRDLATLKTQKNLTNTKLAPAYQHSFSVNARSKK